MKTVGKLIRLDGTSYRVQMDWAATNHPLTDRDIVVEVTQEVTNLLPDETLRVIVQANAFAFLDDSELTEKFARLTRLNGNSEWERLEFALLRPQAEGLRPVIVCTLDEARALLPNFDEVYNARRRFVNFF